MLRTISLPTVLIPAQPATETPSHYNLHNNRLTDWNVARSIADHVNIPALMGTEKKGKSKDQFFFFYRFMAGKTHERTLPYWNWTGGP